MDASTQFSLEQLAEMIHGKLVGHKNDEKNTSNKSKPTSASENNDENVNHETDNIMSESQDQPWQESSTKAILRRRLGISADLDRETQNKLSRTIRTLVSHECGLSLKELILHIGIRVNGMMR